MQVTNSSRKDTGNVDIVNYEALCSTLANKFDTLSKQLKLIAQFVLDQPVDSALDTAAEIATKLGVQPSSLVRFAQAIGFDGFSQIQKILRTHLVQQLPDYSTDYSKRLKALQQTELENDQPTTSILDVFGKANIEAIEGLARDISPEQMTTAIDLIENADTVYLLGQRRSFPVATYLYYMMRNMNVRASLMDGVGGLLHEQTRTIGSGDVLIVITFPSYAEEVISITREVAERGAKIIVITDRLASQAVSVSDVHFFTDKITVGGFRTLSGTMCLAQALSIGLGMSDGRLNRDTFYNGKEE